jgi:guanylate kinase
MTQTKHMKKSKTLNLQEKKWAQGGAVFWSPRKVEEARQREKTKQQEEEAERQRGLKKLRQLSKEKLISYTRTRLLRRSVCSE